MLQALLDFFYNLFQGSLVDTGFSFADLYVHFDGTIIGATDGAFNLTFADYFSLVCSLISLIFIVVLCCLFVYKIIKLIGGLIR